MSAHFSRAELECRCGCGRAEMAPELLEMLEGLRLRFGAPITITSGFRCPERNAAEGGKPGSAHLDGYAVDMAAESGRDRWRLIEAAQQSGFTRIGVAPAFVHVDCHPDKFPRVVWCY